MSRRVNFVLDSRWMLHAVRAVLPRFVIIPSRHSDHQAWYSEPNILAPTNPIPSSPPTCPALFQNEGDSNCPVPRHTAHPQTTNLCTPTTQVLVPAFSLHRDRNDRYVLEYLFPPCYPHQWNAGVHGSDEDVPLGRVRGRKRSPVGSTRQSTFCGKSNTVHSSTRSIILDRNPVRLHSVMRADYKFQFKSFSAQTSVVHFDADGDADNSYNQKTAPTSPPRSCIHLL
ncbi:hypothetical protein EDD17DRAFT_627205 [Pisolithus thermaeus]|nr:hypothetical protein EDD17DRAFT_627205 [Pisolithus thermaeus]